VSKKKGSRDLKKSPAADCLSKNGVKKKQVSNDMASVEGEILVRRRALRSPTKTRENRGEVNEPKNELLPKD